jgi:hypothetical protein
MGVGAGKFSRGYPSICSGPLKFLQKKQKLAVSPRNAPEYPPRTTRYKLRNACDVSREGGSIKEKNGSSFTRLKTSVCRGCRDDIVLEWHGQPLTSVRGRPCVALRTPDQLCNCLGPTLSPARTQGIELLIGGKQHHPRLLCSSRQHQVLHHLLRLITRWPLVPLRHSQWKTR